MSDVDPSQSLSRSGRLLPEMPPDFLRALIPVAPSCEPRRDGDRLDPPDDDLPQWREPRRHRSVTIFFGHRAEFRLRRSILVTGASRAGTLSLSNRLLPG